MAANKVTGIRAALAWSLDTAKLAREHNDALDHSLRGVDAERGVVIQGVIDLGAVIDHLESALRELFDQVSRAFCP
jgi:hypothetical protein